MSAKHQQLTAALTESFKDQKLDPAEKVELRELLLDLREDDLHFMRNQAFDLYRQQSSGAALKWLENLLKLLYAQHHQVQPAKAYFSPGEDCLDAIIHSIQNARSSLDICVFTVSDDRISEALLEAYKRGLKLRLISDNDKVEDRGNDIVWLAERGVDIRVDASPHHMHHKFAIVDCQVLINGSFNWTRSASERNEENIVLNHDPDLIEQFQQQFDSLWARFPSLTF